ncbi:MAG: undecaprenyl/decaprenyl-phosphate alpha-N-acetylglucosaminyl 1-phosphate transferase [Actinobacteria bacterium]|nr:undecaprenyl/decaprenyl-phosphate alpha-N-acetylglucosaminyl 1-phosphate transferase [Actinomycetota bacterium]
MNLMHYMIILAVSAVVTLVATPLVRSASLRLGLVDVPCGRKVHTKHISRLGGVAIFAGFSAAIALQLAGEVWFGWPQLILAQGFQVFGVLGGLLAIFIIGVIDDVVGLSPAYKLLGQAFAASIVIAAGVRIDFIGNPAGGGLIALGLLGVPLTLVYIVGFTNVINLIDGLDGLAAGVSAIGAISFLVIAIHTNQFAAAALAAALIGACIGFLRYNFNPASIFMGDSGAMFLGLALAGISILGVMKSVAAIALAVPLLIIGVPIFDTIVAIIRRIRHQRPIQEADRGHIHHRLLGRGFDQRQTVLIIYLWSAALAVGGYAMLYAPTAIKLATFLLLATLSGVMAYWLGLFEAAHHHVEDESFEEKGAAD